MRLLPEWPKKISDEEYVERLRKNLRITKWMRYFCLFLGVFYLVGVIVVITLLAGILKHDDFGNEQQSLVYLTFILAIVFGVIIGHWIDRAVWMVANAASGNRSERMLVKCWDALHSTRRAG